MKNMGSKARIKKEILPLILKNRTDKDKIPNEGFLAKANY